MGGYASHKACLYILRKYGYADSIRTREDYKPHSHDTSLFDEIDTGSKAYWLGFISADGCVTDNGVVRIALAGQDEGHLVKLKRDLQATHPIRGVTPKGRAKHQSALSINSRKLAGGLRAHGVVPRKSLTMKPPTKVPLHLLRHYWRGMVDGDGSLFVSRKYANLRKAVEISGAN
jgi:hypothetical protein